MSKKMDSIERGMNPVAVTIINPRKEYWPSPGIEPASSCSQVLYCGFGKTLCRALLTETLGQMHLPLSVNWINVENVVKHHIINRVLFYNRNSLLVLFNSFPKRKILDFSKLKIFADDNFKFDENGWKFS